MSFLFNFTQFYRFHRSIIVFLLPTPASVIFTCLVGRGASRTSRRRRRGSKIDLSVSRVAGVDARQPDGVRTFPRKIKSGVAARS